jgi:hypothetical protein
MHPTSREVLAGHLRDLQDHGTTMNILFMTVRTTSDGLLAGIADSIFKLDYPRAGLLDFRRTNRFVSFCKARGLPLSKQRWGKERIYRASIGTDIDQALELIDECFDWVYDHKGPFAADFRPFGWSPAT